MKTLIHILIFGISISTMCANAVAQKPTVSTMEHSMNGVLWMQSAAEVRALQYQAFNLARMVLDQKLPEAMKRPRKPALVVDIDETVLDNSPYQSLLILENTMYPDGWKDWTADASARALPGAIDFLKYAVSRGVDVYYISNRKVAETKGTLKNLQALGFPQAVHDHLLLRDKESSKKSRRETVLRDHEIILLMGDNLNDFTTIFEKKSLTERAASVDELKAEWGQRFIVLPNPMYGDWEGAVYEYNWGANPAEKSTMRREALNKFSRE
jgi:5'-nucleotidase (lipoprotein e(P4) family)